MREASPLLFAVSVLLAACGGASKHDVGGEGGSQAGTNAGGMAGGGTAASGGVTSSSCAATPPKAGSACAPGSANGNVLGFSTADCSWGDDPRPECRTRAVCSSGAWSLTAPSDGCSVPSKPAACPDMPAAPGTACTDPKLQCWYDDGSVCSCSACEAGAKYPICRTIEPPAWACVKATAGCPNPLPQAGSACADPNLQCGVSCELPIRCENGSWHYGSVACPICAAPDTPIATPSGDQAIAALHVGDLVYSVDQGAIVAVPIVRIGSTPVAHHEVLRITLSNAAVIEVSPGHPLASGEPLSSLSVGSQLDEQHRVLSIELVPYASERTYDILPGSSSGTYFAAGALLGSTLGAHSK